MFIFKFCHRFRNNTCQKKKGKYWLLLYFRLLLLCSLHLCYCCCCWNDCCGPTKMCSVLTAFIWICSTYNAHRYYRGIATIFYAKTSICIRLFCFLGFQQIDVIVSSVVFDILCLMPFTCGSVYLTLFGIFWCFLAAMAKICAGNRSTSTVNVWPKFA